MVISIVNLTSGSLLDDFWTLKEIFNKLKNLDIFYNVREKSKHLNKEARKCWVKKYSGAAFTGLVDGGGAAVCS